jgi:hypothetical protein
MRLPAALLGALLVPVLPVLAAAPAQAAIGTICVGAVPAGTTCNNNQTTIPGAIGIATSGDTIRVAAGNTYTDGPYVLPPGVNLRGNGAGVSASATQISQTDGTGDTYLTVSGGTVADVRINIGTGTTTGATGLAATNAVVDNVVVTGTGAANVTGLRATTSQVHDATVELVGSTGSTAIESGGGNLLYADSTWNGGAVGYRLTAGTDNISRVTVRLAQTAISVQGGTLNIDDSVIDLGPTGATGLEARPAGGATSATVNANHLTVVGGGGGSRGVTSDANGAGTLDAHMTLTNSIVRGPATSLVQSAGTGHAATFSATRTDYQTATGTVTDGGGNLINIDPVFANAAAGDYHLLATSPVLDKAASSTASLDRDGSKRSYDGDGDGTATPDMGAFELRDVTAPKTTFSAGPTGPTKDNTPVFQFKANDNKAKFQCRVDAGAYVPCASPVTTTALPDGPHTFSVQATDEALNVENPPATRSFTVDTVKPNAKITKKPGKRFYKARVKFKFTANEPGVTFQCRLDNRPWQKCTSPYRFNVKRGWHTLQVRATDAAKNVDPTPATYRFKRIFRHR